MNGPYVSVGRCDNCGSQRWSVYGVATAPDAVHAVQCRCASCGLVFANPRLSEDALAEVYGQHAYYVGGEADAEAERAKLDIFRPLVERLRAHVPSGRLLDVGSGSGTFLAAAREEGYDAVGIELSAAAVRYGRDRYSVDLREGTLETAAFPAGSFDVANAWHVVEHVFDLDRFVRALRRALRPGGVVLVGTESHAYPSHALLRATQHVRGRVPPAATSTVHTFVFSPGALRDVFERRGFETIELRAYDELSLRERLALTGASSSSRRLAARVIAAGGRALDRAARRGPYLAAMFRARDA